MMLRRLSLLMLLTVMTVSPHGHACDAQTVDENFPGAVETLEKILNDNILPFWYPQVLDVDHGGYRLNHDVDGRWLGPSNKSLVSQARTVWFFARLFRSGRGDLRHLEAARHGYRFLRDALWDKQYGGFYWEVSSDGTHATKPHKDLYGQAFGLYALSEFARASGDAEALRMARRLFSILEIYAYDNQRGGYREFFHRDWMDPQSDVGYLGRTTPETKLMQTHLHLMEAFTTYVQVSRDPVARERLVELIHIQSNAVVRKDVGACTDQHRPDWTPFMGERYDRVSYGHDIENVWLLMDACDAAGIAQGPFRDLYQTLFDYTLRYGFDQESGGFYDSGRFKRPADRRAKIMWVQSEGLVAALYMYRLTGKQKYAECFRKTLAWIDSRQVDWENGDWHASLTDAGEPQGKKTGHWNAPYHNGRAVIRSLELLHQMMQR